MKHERKFGIDEYVCISFVKNDVRRKPLGNNDLTAIRNGEGGEGRTCRLAGLVSVQEASKLFPVSSKSETRIRRSSTMAERGRQGGVGEGKRER